MGTKTQAADNQKVSLATQTKALSGERGKRTERIFSEEDLYDSLVSKAEQKGLTQAGRVLPLVKNLHKGQVRRGKEAVPYVIHPLTMAAHALALGLEEDDIISALLLHDVCEDCRVSCEELPVNETVKTAVRLVTYEIRQNENGKTAHERYYREIAENQIASIVKVIDRCNNISTMAFGFSQDEMIRYIYETEKYVLPLLEILKCRHPKVSDAAFLLEYQMKSILESLKSVIS